MTGDPWTAVDPRPGDFDAVLARIEPTYVERRDGDPTVALRILIRVEVEDARRLERIAARSGVAPHDVLAALLRDADSPAA